MRDLSKITTNNKIKIVIAKTADKNNICIACKYFDPVTRKDWLVYFTNGENWEHASVSSKNKMPTWEVMCAVKNIFWDDNEVCVEYHPRKEDYVNNMAYCLHIWRPLNVELPCPSKELV